MRQNEAMAKSASRQFEQAQRTVFERDEKPADEVGDAIHFLNTNREGILQDVRTGIIDEQFAELMWVGLYHYLRSRDIPTQAKMLSDLHAAQ